MSRSIDQAGPLADGLHPQQTLVHTLAPLLWAKNPCRGPRMGRSLVLGYRNRESRGRKYARKTSQPRDRPLIPQVE